MTILLDTYGGYWDCSNNVCSITIGYYLSHPIIKARFVSARGTCNHFKGLVK